MYVCMGIRTRAHAQTHTHTHTHTRTHTHQLEGTAEHAHGAGLREDRASEAGRKECGQQSEPAALARASGQGEK